MAKFCVNCGKEVPDTANACPSCGTMLADNQNVAPATTVVVNNNVPAQKSNGLAIAGFVVSLVSSFLCCGSFNFISLILSIVGLIKAKDYGGNGKGFAIAGIIISALGFILLLGLYFIGVFAEMSTYGY